ncbi:MAG: hypothetical protein M3Y87_31325 [Myxococcota bacterium]|nr:hypothetical protein [Myxococcota bacterium]
MRAVVTAVLISLLAVSSGCARRSHAYAEVPRVDQRRLRNLHHVAAQQMGCPSAALEAAPLTERVWQVAGCNQVREYAIMSRGRGRYRGARWRPVVPLARRASNELACGVQTLAITATSPVERGVSGCGRSATYAIVCDRVDCAWVMTAYAGAWAGAAGSTSPAGAQPGATILVVPQR